MKHVHKGHEFDSKAQELIGKIGSEDKFLYLFGAGEVGQLAYEYLMPFHCIAGYIDNFPKQKEWNALPIIALNEYLKDPKGIILITVGNQVKDDIAAQLQELGLTLNQDFYYLFDFLRKVFPIIVCYVYKKAYVFDACSIVLTLRCTLRCKDCCFYCSEVRNKNTDMSYQDVIITIDDFFAKFDYSENFELIGGEPLLYKDLSKVIAYVGENYRNKIGVFLITTNGTILPSKELLDTCKKHSVTFKITDYTYTLPQLKESYDRIKRILQENKIKIRYVEHTKYWVDMGFKNGIKPETEAQTIEKCDICFAANRKLYKNKYYKCSIAATVSETLGYEMDNSDYLDLNKIEKDDKISLIEYDLGYTEKGYLRMCQRCNGFYGYNTNYIKAAVQLEK